MVDLDFFFLLQRKFHLVQSTTSLDLSSSVLYYYSNTAVMTGELHVAASYVVRHLGFEAVDIDWLLLVVACAGNCSMSAPPNAFLL